MSNFEDLETWRDEAACLGSDPDIFFSDDARFHKNEQLELETMAKAICAMCNVRAECLDYALVNQEKDGVWGGMSAADRRKALKATRVSN